LGFNGEALDEGSDWYLLGRGMRAYNPGLRRFNSPDPRSVFDTGELNPYTYCLNNPIALRDPSGLTATGDGGRPRRPDEDDPNWLGRRKPGGGTLNWIMLGLGVALTVAAVFTAGASLAAVGALGPAAEAGMSAATMAVRAGTAGFVQRLLVKVAATTIKGTLTNTLFAGLSLGGTAAQAVSVINNDEAAGTAAMILGITAASVAVGKVAFSVGKLAFSGSKAVSTTPTGAVSEVVNNAEDISGAAAGSGEGPSFLLRSFMGRNFGYDRFIFSGLF
jgi:RHS repeat-associated protein